jgi:hypothetical protein
MIKIEVIIIADSIQKGHSAFKMKILTKVKKKEYKKPTNENPNSKYRILVNDPGFIFKIINKIRIAVYPRNPIKPFGIP